MAFTSAVFAQGQFRLDNEVCTGGVAIVTPGGTLQYYTGTAGVEVWELNGTPNPAIINAINSEQGWTAVSAYNLLAADGFMKETTLVGIQITDGVINIASAINMPDVSPAASTVTVALAMWNNASSSWANMLANATAATRAGVIALPQATANLPAAPPVITTWNQDLVWDVPEPGWLSLAGLGAVVLWRFRGRR